MLPLPFQEEEEERSNRWKDFLDRICESEEGVTKDSPVDESLGGANNVAGIEGNQNGTSNHEALEEVATKNPSEARAHKIQIWSQIRPSLSAIEQMMSYRVKKRRRPYSNGEVAGSNGTFPTSNEHSKGVPRSARGASEEESEEEFYDVDRPELVHEASGVADLPTDDVPSFPWKEELESLVRGGLPMALRGEVHSRLY